MIAATTQPAERDNQSHHHGSPWLLHVAAYLFAGVVVYRAAEVVIGDPTHMYLASGMMAGGIFSLCLRRFPTILKVLGVVLIVAALAVVGIYAQRLQPPLIVLMEWCMIGLILALSFTAHAPRHYATMAMATMALGIDSIRHFGATPMAFLAPVVVLGLFLGVMLHGSAPVDVEPAVNDRKQLPWYMLIYKLAAMVVAALLIGRFVANELPVPQIKEKSSPVHLWITFVRSNLGLDPDYGPAISVPPEVLEQEAMAIRRKAGLDLQLNLAQTSPDRLSRKLLYTVDCEVPVYLRTTVFDYYSGLVWGPSMKLELEPLNEGRLPYQFSLPERLPTGLGQRATCRIWPQADSGYQLAVPVQGRTMVRGNLGRIYVDPLQNLYSGERLGRGTHYEAMLGDVAWAQIRDVRIGDDTEAIAEQYLQLPEVSDVLIEYCQRALDGELNRLAAVQRLMAMVGRDKTYSVDPVSLPPSVKESTEYFLFHMDRGACTQFASSLAVACRIVGIPARVAVGYGPGTYRSTAMHYEVREKDAHAWTQVWFPDVGWVDFDATPGGLSLEDPLATPEAEERATLETALDEWRAKLLNWQGQAMAWWQATMTWAAARKWWPVYGVVVAMLLVVLWFSGRFVAGRAAWWWRWRRASRQDPRYAAIILYQCLLERLRRFGVPVESHQTPTEVADQVAEDGFPWATEFADITEGAERLIFGAEQPSADATASLRRQIAALKLQPLPKDKAQSSAE